MFGTTCARPHIGWQVDPFGHARETASLMAMMGFDALFFGRLDEADKQNRFTNKEMELVWKASANQGHFLFSANFFNLKLFFRWFILSIYEHFPRLLLSTRWLLL